jgi:uncharacterized low-complexity protein
MSNNKKPVAIAVGAALAGGLALSGSAFAMQPLAQGYMLSTASVAADKAAEGSCGADKTKEAAAGKAKAEGKCGEGKCGEGKCGMDKMDTDKDGRISKAEFAVAHDGKDDKFAAHDPDSDGFISADEMKAHHAAKAGEGKCGEGKCGEGKCGGDKKADATKTDAKADAEGKCGEGKCGEGKCGSN